ncbi:Death-associated kinase 1 [Olea europaea subsp. europaea]|uniref:Death-associated kinase 1 n=1 Tax=Olea europaea subsp. europaea TaxID=158383 RepID=A0A8S0VEP8_OLEEU|nr:Death-associated kinase 1 [Olea europaea subsp. europaea]
MEPLGQSVSSIFLLEEIKNNLFRNAMNGKWVEVIKIYAERPEAHKAKITRSKDTALHIAISEGQVTTVERLMKILREQGSAGEVLTIGNEQGNTPLHLAASLGNVKMCRLIADVDSTLIGKRNKDEETPFFQAVLNGKRDAFLCLHYICNSDERYSYCKKKHDGETILHSAISGEYFDLAIHIIRLYPKLMNAVTVDGVTPLHLLACKPSAFRSGSYIRGFHKLIYYCIFVDEPEDTVTVHALQQGSQFDTKASCPENYHTCFGFVHLVSKIFRVLTGCDKNENKEKKDAGSCENEIKGIIDAENPKDKQSDIQRQQSDTNHGRSHLPPNYVTCFNAIKLISKSILVILGFGSRDIVKLREKKEKHIWSVQIMNELLKQASPYEYENSGESPQRFMSHKHDEESPFSVLGAGFPSDIPSVDHLSKPDDDQTPKTSDRVERKNGTNGNGNKKKRQEIENGETPLLIAAKNGVADMVEKIITLFPVAIHDMNTSKKNVVLLAVENRQPRVYKFLLKKTIMKESVFRKVDKDGNSALHLAAKLGDNRPWLIPGAALQMQWEIKWYEFVKDSMPLHFFVRHNKESKTARDIFTESHKELVKNGSKWLINTSTSCSVVAALIATVAFATSSTFPGGFKEESDKPTFANEPAFNIFSVASLVALCFSVTSVIMFLAILTSRCY